MKVRHSFRSCNESLSGVHVTKTVINPYIDNSDENKLVECLSYCLKNITILKKVSISKICYMGMSFTHEKIYDTEYIFIFFSSEKLNLITLKMYVKFHTSTLITFFYIN